MIGFGSWYVVHSLSYPCQYSIVLFIQQLRIPSQSPGFDFGQRAYFCKLIEMSTCDGSESCGLKSSKALVLAHVSVQPSAPRTTQSYSCAESGLHCAAYYVSQTSWSSMVCACSDGLCTGRGLRNQDMADVDIVRKRALASSGVHRKRYSCSISTGKSSFQDVILLEELHSAELGTPSYLRALALVRVLTDLLRCSPTSICDTRTSDTDCITDETQSCRRPLQFGPQWRRLPAKCDCMNEINVDNNIQGRHAAKFDVGLSFFPGLETHRAIESNANLGHCSQSPDASSSSRPCFSQSSTAILRQLSF